MLTPERRPALVLSVEACDPSRLIRDTLCGDDGGMPPGRWSARELYLAWLLELPAEIDAAHAAALLVSRLRPPSAVNATASELLALLRRTTAYPRERLEPASPDRARLH